MLRLVLAGLLLTTIVGCGTMPSVKGYPPINAELLRRPGPPTLLPAGPLSDRELKLNLIENTAEANRIRRQLNTLIDVILERQNEDRQTAGSAEYDDNRAPEAR